MKNLFFIIASLPVPDEPETPPYTGPLPFRQVMDYWLSFGVNMFNSLFTYELVPGVTLGWFIVAVFVLIVAIEMLYGKIIK